MNKNLKNMITYNFKTLIGFEIIYKVLTSIIFIPLFLKIFNLIVTITGFDYLTFENVVSFIINPLTIIMLITLLVLITFYTLIDISTIIVILDCSYQKKKISMKEAFIISCNKAFKIFKKKNLLLAFIIIFLIPFLHIGISSSVISTIAIPEFIMDYINSNNFLYLITIALTQLSVSITYFIFIVLGLITLVILSKIFKNINILGSITYTITWLFIALIFIILTLLSTPISYGSISALYYKHKELNKEEIKHIKVTKEEIKNNNPKFNIFKYLVIILTIISCTILTYSALNNELTLNVDYERTLEVTAHRSAFRGAKELGADWIELDVQQTKDKKIIVLHDTNLKRTTGVNKNTWETTYDEIKDLDAGSFFSKEYSEERIPLFEEVVKYAKENNIKLNIELKPTGNETDFESSVVDIIKSNSFEDMCVITSQVYEVLENVKKVTNDIETVYVMSLAYGDITSLTSADNFSIEASSINKKLVNDVHKANKKLYGWTVNTEENINKMIDLNVDNIITDDIPLAKKIIDNRQPKNLIQKCFDYIIEVLD